MALAATLTFTGCKKQQKTADTNSVDLTLNMAEEAKLQQTPQKWHVTNKRICVLFGYDFNNPEIKENLLVILKDNFGLDEDGGLIYPLTYPEDFKHGIRGYASDFAAILQDDELDLAGIVCWVHQKILTLPWLEIRTNGNRKFLTLLLHFFLRMTFLELNLPATLL